MGKCAVLLIYLSDSYSELEMKHILNLILSTLLSKI
jgi:hypothetical protein